MRGKSALSGSGLFLIELLFGLMIFALASAICLQIFVGSHQISNESSNLNRAILAAQNGAECFKASHGNLRETAGFLHGNFFEEENVVRFYYDADWKHVWEDFYYIVDVKRISEDLGCIDGEVIVSDISGNLIFSIPVSTMEVVP